LLLRTSAFRHIDVRSDNFNKLSRQREQRTQDSLDVFDGPVGTDDSELDSMLSFLVKGRLPLFTYSFAIVRMDTL
jgi:hypothetical protein